MLFRSYITKAPLTQNNGIIFKIDNSAKPETIAKFQEHVIDAANIFIESLMLDVYEQQFHYSFDNWLPFLWNKYTALTRYTYVIEDLCSRKIIGYAYGTSMTAELAVQAVKNACLNVADTEGIILHSDLGSQYTGQVFENYLASRGILHSFSRKGNPYDNACIESFHSVLKKEEIYLHTYQDSAEARRAIFEYIEGWYNRKRIHSAIGYMTPQQKEDEELKTAA